VHGEQFYLNQDLQDLQDLQGFTGFAGFSRETFSSLLICETWYAVL
jgi:hypothetical protein